MKSLGQTIAGGVIFSLIGIGMVWWGLRNYLRGRAQVAAAQRWPEATAIVEAADIVSNRSGCFPRIRYRFQAGGQTFTGHRLQFDTVITRFMRTAKARLAPYQPGRAITIRFDPARPQDNVVEPRNNGGTYLIITGAGVLVFLLSFVFWVLVAAR